MQYSIPYILFLFFILFVSVLQLGINLEEKTRKYINFQVIVAYVLFLGFRGFIATDWINYYPLFKNLPTNIILALKENNFEDGFIIYSVLIKNFFTSYTSYQLINTLTDICLLHVFFRKYLPTKYYALGFAVLLAFNGLIFELNLLRNFKALLIFLLALPYLEQRKPFKYFTLMIIALSFHWSSVVFFPLYFFLHKKIPMKIFALTLFVGIFIYLLQIEYIKPVITFFSILLPADMSSKVLGYLNSSIYGESYGLTFGFFERILTAFFLLFYYNKIQIDKANILFVNSFFIFISLFFYFSEVNIVLQRVAGNFAYSYWILIPILIQKTERHTKPFLTVFFVLLIIAKMYLITNIVVYDYDSFLFGKSKSYEQRLDIFQKNKKTIERK